MTHLLEREPIGPAPQTRKERKDFDRHLRDEPALVKALQRAGIRPFTPESVKRYKASMLALHSPSLFRIKACSMFERNIGLQILTIISFVVAVFVGIFTITMVVGKVVSLKWPPLITFAFSFSYFAFCSWVSNTKIPLWELRQLDTNRLDYYRNIPKDVLLTAREVLHFHPRAKIYVDELTTDLKLLDPFLIVKDGRESYYIAVWDEPQFKK